MPYPTRLHVLGRGLRSFEISGPVLAAILLLVALVWPAPAWSASDGQPDAAYAPADGDRYALLIGGLGGNEEYSQTFQKHLFDSYTVLTERFQIPPAHVTVLAEPGISSEPFVDGVSTSGNIERAFDDLAERATEADQVYVFLFGHGSYDGDHAYLNIPERDLNEADYADLVDRLNVERLVFVNTASASAPFGPALSGPGRTVITATRAPTQRNATVFPRFWIEALQSAAADQDKDTALSVREAFMYASERTAQFFEDNGHLATERALLEDTGDGTARPADQLSDTDEGSLAASTYLKPRAVASGTAGNATSEQARTRETLRREIDELKRRKDELAEDDYYAQLEALFVRLARINNQIEQQ